LSSGSKARSSHTAGRASGQPLGFFYFEDESVRQRSTNKDASIIIREKASQPPNGSS